MYLEPYSDISWAYRLHYYICFRTYRRRQFFTGPDHISSLLEEICSNHDYHLLKVKPYPNHVRCLISLQPGQAVSKVVQILKANSSGLFASRFGIDSPLWARGYLAQGIGRIQIEAVRHYLTQQPEHHGYAARIRPPVFRYRVDEPQKLRAAHASFELNYHLVFATSYRAGVFTSDAGGALGHYWLKVAAKHGFVIDQFSFVPDHVHLMMRTTPSLSVEACALALLNNGQHFMGSRFPGLMIGAGVERLWQASAFAGTCGRMTTALIKSFLSQE